MTDSLPSDQEVRALRNRERKKFEAWMRKYWGGIGLEGAEEDNHVPHGKVRNFWRPVAELLVGKECECKAEEPVIREDKGDFIWRP